MAKTDRKVVIRKKRIRSIRRKISGSPERPRLRVFKSNRHIYAQIIDDVKRITVVSMSTKDKDFVSPEGKGKSHAAEFVGKMIAEKAKNVGIEKVVFDRGGYIYHGRVKALSDGARKGGLIF